MCDSFTNYIIESMSIIFLIFVFIVIFFNRKKFNHSDERSFDTTVGLCVAIIVGCFNTVLIQKFSSDKTFFTKEYLNFSSAYDFVLNLGIIFFIFLILIVLYFLCRFKKEQYEVFMLAELFVLFGLNGISTGFVVAISIANTAAFNTYVYIVGASISLILFGNVINLIQTRKCN